MINFLNIFLHVISIISFICAIFITVTFGVVDYLFGPEDAKKLLEKFNIPLSYNQVLIVGFLCLVIMAVSYIVRKKLCGEL